MKPAINVTKETGHPVTPEIMIPLVGDVKELKYVKNVVVKTADKLIAESGLDMKYEVGTMIEIPRVQSQLIRLQLKLNSSHLVLMT